MAVLHLPVESGDNMPVHNSKKDLKKSPYTDKQISRKESKDALDLIENGDVDPFFASATGADKETVAKELESSQIEAEVKNKEFEKNRVKHIKQCED
jgi:hypothetical protein